MATEDIISARQMMCVLVSGVYTESSLQLNSPKRKQRLLFPLLAYPTIGLVGDVLPVAANFWFMTLRSMLQSGISSTPVSKTSLHPPHDRVAV